MRCICGGFSSNKISPFQEIFCINIMNLLLKDIADNEVDDGKC